MLADPTYNVPNHVDLLLGAAIYAKIQRPGFKEGSNGGPTAQNTAFGWILYGEVPHIHALVGLEPSLKKTEMNSLRNSGKLRNVLNQWRPIITNMIVKLISFPLYLVKRMEDTWSDYPSNLMHQP